MISASVPVIAHLYVSLLLGVLHVALCTDDPASTQQSEIPRFDDLYEAALRALPGFPGADDETVFISMGRNESGNYIDPPPEFLARFRDLKQPVKPASAARRVAKKPGSRLWQIEDAETGKRGRIYFKNVQERRAADEVLIEVGFVSGVLGGAGQRILYKIVDDEWKLQRVLLRWIE